ncbi:MAG: hypothetical protein ACRC53_12370 [Plesiomonas sp.]|uniref:hypothetical protein n=1 Tax=Plesiomonas sp. TaxID=2486279 RepID=UPI003F31336B
MKSLFSSVLLAALLALSFSSVAGSVNGQLTKIRAYEKGRKIEFKSRVPNVSFSLTKVDILKAMTRFGKTTAVADLEKNGLIINTDRKALVTLDRVRDGLYIKGKTLTMFITEKELDRVR